MKFEIKNRYSRETQFVADIDCKAGNSIAKKNGLAVRWAIKNNANLCVANLSGAYLCGANLGNANLGNADLGNANLSGAYLGGAYLCDADLSGADLSDANLSDANLGNADLRGADLRGANLSGANLSGANLSGADLCDAGLRGTHGINDYVKCMQFDAWPVTYTSNVIQIGCQRHSIELWRGFDDDTIAAMDGKTSLKFWRKYKEIIFQMIELCPAKPTKSEDVE